MSVFFKQRLPLGPWTATAIAATAVAIFVTTLLWNNPSRVANRPASPPKSARVTTRASLPTAPSVTERIDPSSLEKRVPSDPEGAAILARQLAEKYPAQARDYGYALIAALQRAGEFERAASYAASDTTETQRDLLIAAFHEWSRQQPEPAFNAATQVADAAAREIALQSVLSGWARANPESLAELAVDRPDGPEKTAALTKALREWVHRDPEKAGDWIAAHESTIPIVEKMFRDDRR